MIDLIVIPARFGSTRLPGKPLKQIAGHSLLARVASVAMQAQSLLGDAEVVVATDNSSIQAHALELGLSCVMTDPEISSGSGRALAAAQALDCQSRFILNLQGDAPFTSPTHIQSILDQARVSDSDVTTPLVQLSWEALDRLRAHKRETPFSGTTCVRSPDGKAYWFSKSILPVIRKEKELRAKEPLSPVFQHIGLYCYRTDALERFESAPESAYETLEGLEQLRILELGMTIQTVVVPPAQITMSGIDNPEDLDRAESLIATYGDPFVDWRNSS